MNDKITNLDFAIMQLENQPRKNQLNENLLHPKQLMEDQRRMLQNNSDDEKFRIDSTGVSFPSPGKPSQESTDFFWNMLGLGIFVTGIGFAIWLARKE